MDAESVRMNRGLVFDGLLFPTHRDRGLYIRNRAQWLKDNPDIKLRRVLGIFKKKQLRLWRLKRMTEPRELGRTQTPHAATRRTTAKTVAPPAPPRFLLKTPIQTTNIQLLRSRCRLFFRRRQSLNARSRLAGDHMLALSASLRCCAFRRGSFTAYARGATGRRVSRSAARSTSSSTKFRNGQQIDKSPQDRPRTNRRKILVVCMVLITSEDRNGPVVELNRSSRS